jgi:TM2 domain-containing membrane protein YozV
MNKLLKAYSKKWYVPVLVAGILGLICLWTILIQSKVIFHISLGVPFFALLVSGSLGLLKLFRKKVKAGILQIASTIALGLFGVFILSIYLMFYPYDFYADSLVIPKNIEVNLPKKEPIKHSGSNTPSANHVPANNHFELYNSFQPGLYHYKIWLSRIDKGIVFLKAFEVSENDRLSEHMLRKRSEVVVGHSKDTMKLYSTVKHFTIYEGDWGKPYAARFELWYKEQGTKQEVKLLEKNYKIEGWQR